MSKTTKKVCYTKEDTENMQRDLCGRITNGDYWDEKEFEITDIRRKTLDKQKTTEGEYVRRQNRICPKIVEIGRENTIVAAHISNYCIYQDETYNGVLEKMVISLASAYENHVAQLIDAGKRSAQYQINTLDIVKEDKQALGVLYNMNDENIKACLKE